MGLALTSSNQSPDFPPSRSHVDYNGQFVDDEIDLFELAQGLWNHKWWVVAATVVAVALAAVYLFVTTPTYEVEAVVQQASNADLAPLNVPGIEYELSAETALSVAVRELSSYQTRAAYWQSHKDMLGHLFKQPSELTEAQVLARFDASHYTLQAPKPEGDQTSILDRYLHLSLTYPAGVEGAVLLNGLLAHAIAQAQKEVTADWNTTRQRQLENLLFSIRSKRAEYHSRVVNRKAKLSEAIRVAENLGIVKPTTLSDFGEMQNATNSGVVRMAINNNDLPLYFMGTQALGAELHALKARSKPSKGDSSATPDPLADMPQDEYIDGLAALKSKARYLKHVQPDFSRLALVNVSREAVPSAAPIKPNSRLVLALALVLGLMVGTLLALLRAAWVKRNTETRAETNADG